MKHRPALLLPAVALGAAFAVAVAIVAATVVQQGRASPPTSVPAALSPPPRPSPSPSTLGLSTLPWAGGPAYYRQFSLAPAAGWTSPGFFPLGAWLEGVHNSSEAGQDRAVGLNMYVSLTDDSVPSVIAAAGMTALGDGAQPPGQGPETVGYVLSDEVDGWAGPGSGPYGGGWPGHGTICTTSTPCGYTAMSELDASVPQGNRTFKYMGYTTGVLEYETEAQAAQFVNDYQDVVAADLYWYTQTDASCSDKERFLRVPVGQCRLAANYGANVERLRHLQTVNNNTLRPVWMDVELGCPFTDTPARCITPAQTAGATWSSIIHGAMGIVYFNHSFSGPCQTQNIIRDTSCPQDAAASSALATLNAGINAMAPVLNTQSYGYTFNGHLDTMLKYYNGSYYLFAMLSRGSAPGGPYTLTMPPGLNGSSVSVLNEDRTIATTGAAFVDTFDEETTVHIYKITPGP